MRARAIAWTTTLATLVALAPSPQAHAAEPTAKALGLHMRGPQAPPTPEPAPEPTPEPTPEPPRTYSGPTAVIDVPGREAPWQDPDASPATGTEPTEGAEPAPGEVGPGPAAAPPKPAVTAKVPPPSSVREVPEHLLVAVGLAPEAPGSRDEKALLSALEASVRASTDPTTDVRRLRPGAGAPHRICREQREDLVVMIGYVADRPTPVVLAHDCRLDRALAVRAADAAREPGLVSALWDEHLELMRSGARERRRLAVGPKARAGIISGVAILVVGVAVGALVASALRKETVVITVRP